jgi:hypothetical protein
MWPKFAHNSTVSPDRIGANVPWWLVVIMVFLMLLSISLDQFLTRRSISTVILQATLPTHCTSTEPLFPWSKRRSSAPEPAHPYCGVMITEHGSFRVIEDGMFVPGGTERKEIIESLRPICSVRLYYFGWDKTPERWPGYNPETALWVYGVQYDEDCKTQPFVGD